MKTILVYSLLAIIMAFFFYRLSTELKKENSKNNVLKKWFLFLIPVSIYAFVMGVRWDVGRDYLNYLDSYLSNNNVFKYEFIYLFIESFLSRHNAPAYILFGICAFIQAFTFFIAFNRDNFLRVLLVVLVFLLGETYTWNNIIRSSIAFCIWIIALSCVEMGFRYFILMIVACGFHTIAIPLMLLYPISRYKFSLNKVSSSMVFFLLLVCVLFVRLNFEDILITVFPVVRAMADVVGFSHDYDIFSLMSKNEQQNIYLLLFYLFVDIHVLLSSRSLKFFYRENMFSLYYGLYVIGLFFYYAIPQEYYICTRIFRPLYSLRVIIWAYYFYYLFKNHSNYIINRLKAMVFLSACMIVFVVSNINAPRDSHLIYQTIWERDGQPIRPRER